MPKKDLNQLAHSILQQAIGEEVRPEESAKAKAGRKGGVKGGAKRMADMTEAQRKELAQKAAKARWGKGKTAPGPVGAGAGKASKSG